MIDIKLQSVLKLLNSISGFFAFVRLYFNIFLNRSNYIGIISDAKLDIGLYQIIITGIQKPKTKFLVLGYDDVKNEFSIQTLLHKYSNRVFFLNLNSISARIIYYYIDSFDSHGSFRNIKYFPFKNNNCVWHGEPAKTIISNSDSYILTDNLYIPNFGYYDKLKFIFRSKNIIISKDHPRFNFLKDLGKISSAERIVVLAPTYLNSKGSNNPDSYKSDSNLFDNFLHYLCISSNDFLQELNKLFVSFNFECHIYFHPYDKFVIPNDLESIKVYEDISLITKYEILSNAKFLITDSSSIAFDAIELNVPVINIHHQFVEANREKIYVDSKFNVQIDQFIYSIKQILFENDII